LLGTKLASDIVCDPLSVAVPQNEVSRASRDAELSRKKFMSSVDSPDPFV
jgi:hypothetical protein